MQVFGRDLLRIRGERKSALEDVFELAYVARKGIALERSDRLGGELRRIAPREPREERVRNERNVLAHFAQARHSELDDVRTVGEGLPEFARLGERAELIVRG